MENFVIGMSAKLVEFIEFSQGAFTVMVGLTLLNSLTLLAILVNGIVQTRKTRRRTRR